MLYNLPHLHTRIQERLNKIGKVDFKTYEFEHSVIYYGMYLNI